MVTGGPAVGAAVGATDAADEGAPELAVVGLALGLGLVLALHPARRLTTKPAVSAAVNVRCIASLPPWPLSAGRVCCPREPKALATLYIPAQNGRQSEVISQAIRTSFVDVRKRCDSLSARVVAPIEGPRRGPNQVDRRSEMTQLPRVKPRGPEGGPVCRRASRSGSSGCSTAARTSLSWPSTTASTTGPARASRISGRSS